MQHEGLPVAGYSPQSTDSVDIVNGNKRVEEQVLRLLDKLSANPRIDVRWLSIGRTHLEQAFMAINRAIFRPTRVTLPEDEPAQQLFPDDKED
jgi:hypothetical protein